MEPVPRQISAVTVNLDAADIRHLQTSGKEVIEVAIDVQGLAKQVCARMDGNGAAVPGAFACALTCAWRENGPHAQVEYSCENAACPMPEATLLAANALLERAESRHAIIPGQRTV